MSHCVPKTHHSLFNFSELPVHIQSKSINAIHNLMRNSARHARKLRRRRRHRRRSRGRHIVHLQRSMWDRGYGFPDRIVTRLRYDQVGNMTTTGGSIVKQVWRANSVFDPDFTGAGHQPLYFDQFAAIYNQYAVIKSKITTVFTMSEGGTVPILCGLVGDDDGTTSTTFATLQEKSHGSSRVLMPTTGANNCIVMSERFHCKKHLTIDPFSSETYKTAIGSNPTGVS